MQLLAFEHRRLRLLGNQSLRPSYLAPYFRVI